MIVYRLSKSIYAYDLNGKGAAKVGGRWNSKGVEMLYTSESRSLCTVEIAVHTPLGILPANYMLVSLNIPDDVEIRTIYEASLPDNWKSFPHSHLTQEIGDDFVKDRQYAVLKVPSAVVKGDYNFLINPSHRNSGKIQILEIEPFIFDKRLF